MFSEIKDAIWNFKAHHASKPTVILLSVNQYVALEKEMITKARQLSGVEHLSEIRVNGVLAIKKMDCLDLSEVGFGS